MLRINPFAAWRPKPEFAKEVACVPYDVINTSEARELAKGLPRSFLHVIRSEIDLPANTHAYDDAVYRKAVDNFAAMRRDGTLFQEPQPSIYIYRLEMKLLGRTLAQTGVVACCHIDDYGADLIKKHEKTRKDKEDDRTRHVLEMNANAEPVFLMYQDESRLASLIASAVQSAPLYDFTAADGVKHTIWKADDAKPYVEAFKGVPHCYVADGHHRTASAARAGAERRAKNPNHTGHEEYNWFLAVLFPSSELTILPYHRAVADLNGLSAGDFIAKLRTVGTVTENAGDHPGAPKAPGSFNVYVGGTWLSVTLPESSINRRDPIGSLDCELLSQRVLTPILGIGDLRTDKRIDFIGGIRGPGELKKRVDSGSAAVAFSMFPTTIEQLIAVANAGQIMPPKSTWFEPKLRSGLLVHTLE